MHTLEGHSSAVSKSIAMKSRADANVFLIVSVMFILLFVTTHIPVYTAKSDFCYKIGRPILFPVM